MRRLDSFTDDPMDAPRGFAVAGLLTLLAFAGAAFLGGFMWSAFPTDPVAQRAASDVLRLP